MLLLRVLFGLGRRRAARDAPLVGRAVHSRAGGAGPEQRPISTTSNGPGAWAWGDAGHGHDRHAVRRRRCSGSRGCGVGFRICARLGSGKGLDLRSGCPPRGRCHHQLLQWDSLQRRLRLWRLRLWRLRQQRRFRRLRRCLMLLLLLLLLLLLPLLLLREATWELAP